jgi:dGTPase
LLEQIALDIRSRAREFGIRQYTKLTYTDVFSVLLDVFAFLIEDKELMEALAAEKRISYGRIIDFALRSYQGSIKYAESGYLRTQITAGLVGQFISGVVLVPNFQNPALSIVRLDPDTWLRVEVLKRYCYESLIMSSRMKVAEQRGREIVSELFKRLTKNRGHHLLPTDFRTWHENVRTKRERMRVICDFIAGMTDRYAVEFHARLTAEKPESMFKPI